MAEATDDRLRLLVERYERLTEEENGIKQDKRDVIAEAKAVGYCGVTFRKVIARRAMTPDDRAEADTMLALYEAALGGAGVNIPDARPDAEAIAHAMLTEQVAGLDDPERARALVAHVLGLLQLRGEIAELRKQESARKKLAKADGFEPKQIAVTVRWFEKCAKHGEAAMQAGEATFQLYRATYEAGAAVAGAPVSADPALAAMFTPALPKPTAKTASAAAQKFADDMARKAAEGKI